MIIWLFEWVSSFLKSTKNKKLLATTQLFHHHGSMGYRHWPTTHVTHPKMVTNLTHDPWRTDPFPSLTLCMKMHWNFLLNITGLTVVFVLGASAKYNYEAPGGGGWAEEGSLWASVGPGEGPLWGPGGGASNSLAPPALHRYSISRSGLYLEDCLSRPTVAYVLCLLVV